MIKRFLPSSLIFILFFSVPMIASSENSVLIQNNSSYKVLAGPSADNNKQIDKGKCFSIRAGNHSKIKIYFTTANTIGPIYDKCYSSNNYYSIVDGSGRGGLKVVKVTGQQLTCDPKDASTFHDSGKGC